MGLELSIGTLVLVVLLAVIVFFIIISNEGIVKGQEQPLRWYDITSLCPEWQKNDCSCESAGSIEKEFGDDLKSLQSFCQDEYEGNWCESCKKLCLGCPIE
ncbi:MAG: hypothetical protein JW700_02230 [Candidatus Aenigmarchaeota archaeon]|nr:hypothetical protein [Candidatus Aenigmarchaeota archaeon]